MRKADDRADFNPLPPPRLRPRMRGVFHQIAFFVSIVACLFLIAHGRDARARLACLIYSAGLLCLFGTSALYHRRFWEPKARAIMKRLDHSAIFLLIAGSSTPFALLALPEDLGRKLVIIIWSIAIFGVAKSIFWIKAPRTITAALYVAAGWAMFPYLPLLRQSLSASSIDFIIMGGLIYTVGALLYAIKRPVLNPVVFGYHEFFHLLTIVAAAFHFAAIYALTSP